MLFWLLQVLVQACSAPHLISAHTLILNFRASIRHLEDWIVDHPSSEERRHQRYPLGRCDHSARPYSMNHDLPAPSFNLHFPPNLVLEQATGTTNLFALPSPEPQWSLACCPARSSYYQNPNLSWRRRPQHAVSAVYFSSTASNSISLDYQCSWQRQLEDHS